MKRDKMIVAPVISLRHHGYVLGQGTAWPQALFFFFSCPLSFIL